MPEAATGGVLWKTVFFKISQNSKETPVPEETSVNFAKFLRTPFLQKGPYNYHVHTEGGWGSLEICHVFADSIVFKQ